MKVQPGRYPKSSLLIEVIVLVTGNELYWSASSDKTVPTTEPSDYFGFWYYRPPAADVEMTGYALMSYLKHKQSTILDATKIIKWLSKQRNNYGRIFLNTGLWNLFNSRMVDLGNVITKDAHHLCWVYTIGRLQLAAIFVYFLKQAKIAFVIHGDIGSETTKLAIYDTVQCLYNQAKYRKLTVNCLAGIGWLEHYQPRWRLTASSDVMCKLPINWTLGSATERTQDSGEDLYSTAPSSYVNKGRL